MRLSLHVHAVGDPVDRIITDTTKTMIDAAAREKISVLAFSFHQKFFDPESVAAHAKKRGVVLLPAIEVTIDGCHVIILNANADAEKIQTFGDLHRYRKKRGRKIFVVAPHPFHFSHSLGRKFLENAELFDAVEWSGFLPRWMNRRAALAAFQVNLPVIATSDAHRREMIKFGCVELPTEIAKTPVAIFAALRRHEHRNIIPSIPFAVKVRTFLWLHFSLFEIIILETMQKIMNYLSNFAPKFSLRPKINLDRKN